MDPIAIAATWHPTLFPWAELHAKFRPDFKRFELAVWVGEDLQALCLGRPSHGPQNVTLHVLERRRGERSLLKGCAALIATDVAEAYAKVLDKEIVRLKAPVAGARETYRRLGFTDAGKIGSVPYMTRQVRP